MSCIVSAYLWTRNCRVFKAGLTTTLCDFFKRITLDKLSLYIARANVIVSHRRCIYLGKSVSVTRDAFLTSYGTNL